MAMDNLKDFAIQWGVLGLLFFGMMAFAMSFMVDNNPIGLGVSSTQFENHSGNVMGKLTQIETDSNELLNITTKNNPEVGQLGSGDSVPASYSLVGSARSFLSSFKLFMVWIIPGTAGQMLVAFLVGIFGIMSFYFITKWIRIGA